MTSALPLAALRVVDLTVGAAQGCGRLLADLGADVVLVEPPGGCGERTDEVRFGLRNANKRGITRDLTTAEGRARLHELAAEADLLLTSLCGPTPEDLLAAHPGLVVVSLTDFGRTGPYRDLVATEAVLAARGGVLARSGLPGEPPVLPPAGLIDQTFAVHAAWAALVGYVQRLRTGVGEIVELDALTAVVQGFDPGFGTKGSAAAGRAEGGYPRGRPDAADYYPVFRCADGHVRICLLAKRQWRGMFEWLGRPEEFADPRYDLIPARFAAADRLHLLIGARFAGQTRDALVAEGTRRGVPIAAVLDVPEVLAADHFTATGALADVELADGVQARVPTGPVRVDGQRAGLRHRAPRVGEHNAEPWSARVGAPALDLGLGPSPDGRPLTGLRVLDLGVIVVGAELGRLFADQGADVIKVENDAFPDGLRQTTKGGGMNASFAWGHRNKRSLGLDLRSPDGAALFRELVAQSDVLAANFKPGTLEALGLSREQLAELNPRVIVSDSSAFGSTGPWSDRPGYGPLVRASTGVSALWSVPHADGNPAFCDGDTVYPDHVAGHLAAVAVLAAILGRASTGVGVGLEIAQADVALEALGPTLATWPGAPATARVEPRPGDDEWEVRDGELTAPMVRLPELLENEHLIHHQTFTTMIHPLLPGPLPAIARHARFSSVPDAPQNPAPMPGDDTVAIATELLGLAPAEIAKYVECGVLQSPTVPGEHQ